MRLGVHVRIAKGLAAAIGAAERLGCEAIQIFSSNPNSWRIGVIDPSSAEAFRAGVERLDIRPVALHTPYLLNLAWSKDSIWHPSWRSLASALERAETLGADYVVTHIGSHGGAGFDAGAYRVKDAVSRAIDKSPGSAVVLLEGGSVSGNTIGSTIEELSALLKLLEDHRERVSICLDTAHLWAAGYDISSAEGVDRLLSTVEGAMGLSRLRLLHCNDTQKELGSHIDRHWHIGQGRIGIEGFRAFVNHPALKDVGGIVETPEMETGKDVENLEALRALRAASNER
ncbi:MAG: deoxyribonuclease IV [Armatimonadetes bacterium]|nr:deoxyribonuclease IV [Armatimonadota bacterium]